MFNINEFSKKVEKKPKKVPVGTFEAVVKNVQDAKDYVPGQAIQIVYDVKVDNTIIEYCETFIIKEPIPNRTEDLSIFLDENGFETVDDLIGAKLRLTFLKEVVGNRTFVNIVDRALLKGDDD